MSGFVLSGGPVAGAATTFTRYLATPTRRGTPRRAYLSAATTITADATNYWTFDIQAGGVSILTTAGTLSTLSTADGTITGGTPAAFTCNTTKRVTAGQALTLVATIAASGADQSSNLFTVNVEFGD